MSRVVARATAVAGTDRGDDEAGGSSHVTTFRELALNPWLVDQCKALGMTRPTPVQYHCIPQILTGRDCIGCAKTGSGKTAAFTLPILQQLCQDPYGIYALILTPTRELAIQISQQFNVLGKPIGVKVLTVVGGMSMVEQGLQLARKPHIVIATPGRLADHVTNSALTLPRIKFLVLDEADRLLSEDNFTEQLHAIFNVLPERRQTLLFSATITDALERLKEMALTKPFYWNSDEAAEQKGGVVAATVEELDQRYVLVPAHVKDGYLVRILTLYHQQWQEERRTRHHQPSSIIIFVNTCRMCQLLVMTLRELGLQCAGLHSMCPQRERHRTLEQFKGRTGEAARMLVATDVASRGLDIPSVDVVINYELPREPKTYVHRVGRTARAGRKGLALSLVTQHDIVLLKAIEDKIKVKLSEHKVSEREVLKLLTEVTVTKSECEIKLDEVDFGEKEQIYKRKKLILQGMSPEEADAIIKEDKDRKKGQGRQYDTPRDNNIEEPHCQDTTHRKEKKRKINSDNTEKHTHNLITTKLSKRVKSVQKTL